MKRWRRRLHGLMPLIGWTLLFIGATLVFIGLNMMLRP